MAKQARGEITRKIGGEEIILALDFNALCEMEDHFGVPLSKIGEVLSPDGEISARTIRKVFQISMLKHNPAASEADAGAVLTELGPDMMTTLMDLIDASGLMQPAAVPKSGEPKLDEVGNAPAAGKT